MGRESTLRRHDTARIRRGAWATLLALPLLTGLASAEVKVLASVNELFYYPYYRVARISPDGRRVAVHRREKNVMHTAVLDLESGDERVVFQGDPCLPSASCVLRRLDWADDETLVAGWYALDHGGTAKRHYYGLVTFADDADPLAFEKTSVKAAGIIIDPLPHAPGELLFQHFERGRAVYRVRYADLAQPDRVWRRWKRADSKEPRRPLASFDEDVVTWVSDEHGEIRGALTIGLEPLALRLRYRKQGDPEWRIAQTLTDEEKVMALDLFPLGFTADGESMLVFTNPDDDRHGLYEYDLEAGEPGRLVYQHETADLLDVIYDASGQRLLGVRFVEEGEIRETWFDTGDQRLRVALNAAFPGRNPMTTGISDDGRMASVQVSAPGDPGGFYVLDTTSGETREIGRIRPWLDNNILARSEAFRVVSRDGVEVTAFLTLPPEPNGTPPLVVMPHGGPIGVADRLTYNTDIQYLARMGYAILRVNFRGSGDRGRSFRTAGNRQWGRGIEDDIEAAIDQVVEKGLVDGDRICTHGASYGGYSALMLVVRRPDAYRCASSLMGVSDIALMFNHDDVFLGERGIETMEEIVGSPEEDYTEQLEYSPLYNAGRIKVPVLLAHGHWDRRVDWDHFVRMKIMLELEGTPVRTIELARTGHGFRTRHDAIEYHKALREFLLQHIGR